MAPQRAAGAAPNIVLPRQEWSMGAKLGQGAQGSVYAIVDQTKKQKSTTQQHSQWALKITAKPPPGVTAKSKSKKHAAVWANASSLNKEALLYNAHLKPLLGRFIPAVPSDVQGLRESNGFQYIVMERMHHELFGDMEELAQGLSSNSNTINVGPLAGALLEIVQAVHSVRQLIIDVKPENFMFAQASKPQPSKKKNPLMQRLRLVDFGLMKPFSRPEPTGSLQGNAMYASLNMHQLQNSSRRDDVEMALYMTGEALIRLQAQQTGTTHQYETTPIHSYLPWAHGANDDDIYQQKRQHVQDYPTSEFYQRMPPAAAQALHQALQEVWDYSFNAEPDYQGLQSTLATLHVTQSKSKAAKGKAATKATTANKKKAAAAKKAPPQTTTRARRAQPVIDLEDSENDDDGDQQEEEDDESDDDVEVWSQGEEDSKENDENFQGRKLRSGRKIGTPAAAKKTTATKKPVANKKKPAPKKRAPVRDREDDDDDSENRVKASPPKRRGRSRAKTDSMQVDLLYGGSEDDSEDESDVEMADSVKKEATSDAKGPVSIRMMVHTEEDGKPAEHTLEQDMDVIIGSKPTTTTKKNATTTLIRAVGADANHCKLSLVVKRGRAIHVMVKDLNSPSGMFVGRSHEVTVKPIKKGAQVACVIPGEITLGTVRVEFLRG